MLRTVLCTLCAVSCIVSTANAETVRAPVGIRPGPATLVTANQLPKQDKGAPADTFTPAPDGTAKKDPFDLFSGGPAGFLLSQYLKTTVDFAPDAARRQRMALSELQKADESVKRQMVSELVAAYQRLPEEDYDRRWLLIDTLAQLERAEAVEHLSGIALTALPPERLMRKGEEWSSRDDEIAIRLAAVRGLARLSAMKVSAADKKLISIAGRSTLPAIKKQAIQGYLDAPVRSLKTGTLEGYRKSPDFNRRFTDLKRQLPAEAQRLADEVVTVKPDIAVPDEVKQAVQNRKTRQEPATNDAPPVVKKGGLQ